MDTDKIKIFGARVKVESTGKLAELEKAEREKMKAKVDKIKAHGINCFVNRQLIYNFPEEIFADAGVMAIEHADFDGIERLALVTGARPCGTSLGGSLQGAECCEGLSGAQAAVALSMRSLGALHVRRFTKYQDVRPAGRSLLLMCSEHAGEL